MQFLWDVDFVEVSRALAPRLRGVLGHAGNNPPNPSTPSCASRLRCDRISFYGSRRQEVYLSVDRERNVFNISQAVFESPMPQQDLVTIEPLDETGGSIIQTGQSTVAAKKLSIGAIVGIAIGGVAFLLLLLGFAWLMYRRRRQVSPASRNERQSLEHPPEDASKIAELGSGSKGETNAWTATDCELPGSSIGDLRPAQEKQGSYAYEHGYCANNIVEADNASRVYELPTPIVELPANNDTREMKDV